jgi:hypothetical protein
MFDLGNGQTTLYLKGLCKVNISVKNSELLLLILIVLLKHHNKSYCYESLLIMWILIEMTAEYV